LVLLAAAIGCKPPKASYLQAAPPAKPEPGWKTVGGPKEGFTLAFPASYEVMDASAFEQAMSKGGGNVFGASSKEKENSTSLMATTMAGGTLGVVMVAKTTHEANCSREVEAADIAASFDGNGNLKNVKTEEMDLPVGKATRVEGDLKRAGGMSGRMTAYVLVDGKVSYTAIFIGLSSDSKVLPTRKMMRSFRPLKPKGA